MLGQPTHILGTVSDSITNEGLSGVRIHIENTSFRTISDLNGNYELAISNYPYDSVEIIYVYLGYDTKSIKLSVQDISSVPVTVSLSPSTYLTQDVVITASKGLAQYQEDLPVSISVIQPKFIDLQATPEVTKILNRIPGVDEQDGQINIRGSSGYAYGVGSRVMVAVDGLPMLSSESTGALTDLIPVDNISQIEVLKGASSVLYGSGAMGGVINIITNDQPTKTRTSVRLRGGFFDTPSNEALDWDGDAYAYQASAHIYHTQRFGDLGVTAQTDFIKDTGYRQATDAESFRGLMRLDYAPSGISGLTARLQVISLVDSGGSTLYWRSYLPDSSYNIQGNDSSLKVSGGALTPTEDSGGNRKQFKTQWSIDPSIKYLSPKGDLLWYRGRFLSNKNTNDAEQSNRNSIFYHDIMYKRSWGNIFSWTAGVAFNHSVARGDSLFGGTAVINGREIEGEGKHTGNSLGLYTQVEAEWKKINASLGFRWERVKIDTLPVESNPIIRAGINYEVRKGTNLRASFGQAFRVPSVAERFTNTTGGGLIIKPNPDIQSETGYSVEIGARQGFLSQNNAVKLSGYVDIAGFMMEFDNMIEFGLDTLILTATPGGIGTDVEFTTVNVSNARIKGIEITSMANLTWDNWNLSFSGGITWIDPEDLNAVPDNRLLDLSGYPQNLIQLIADIQNPNIVDQPETLKYRSRQLIRTSLSLNYKQWGLSANFRRRSFIEQIDQYLFVVVEGLGEFREAHPNGENIWDFILSYQPRPQHQFSLNIDNAINEEYLVIPGTLAPQRFFSLQYIFRI